MRQLQGLLLGLAAAYGVATAVGQFFERTIEDYVAELQALQEGQYEN